MTKRKSTIIIGIFLIVSILFVAWLILINLKEQFAGLSESASSNTPENAGELIFIYNGATAIGGLAILIVAYIPAFIVLINSSVSIIFSI